MLTLVLGGAASGKSEYAEQLLCGCKAKKLYVATMQPYDEECRARIARHRAARAQKGFDTLECPTGLEHAQWQADAVLLECMSNLVANELFDPCGAGENAELAVLRGVTQVCERAAQVVIVSNAVFSDGVAYDTGTAHYIAVLAAVNRAIAAQADHVVEVVCGIPISLK